MNAKYLMSYAMLLYNEIIHINCTGIRVFKSWCFNKIF